MPADLEDAIELVLKNFRGVRDKGNEPYVLHCLRVMLGVSDPNARQVAVMHDLVEDTEVSLADLRQQGFHDDVVDALALVTHDASLTYAEYVVRLKRNPLSRQVKLADLRDNYSIDRVAYREEHASKDARRTQRYILSYQFLTDKIDESTYRRQMQLVEDQ
jgi:hypothetical protein